ncbi:MAG: FlgD immunoglobulin-like domain containing protein, partial [Planctomycetota bacterium]
DTYPFNEDIAPGSAAFDTTTALIKNGGNIAFGSSDWGVILGDSTQVSASYATDTRLDLIFRILPGPGNYADPGNTNSPLIDKDATHSFWAAYLEDNGPFGTPGGHAGGIWDPDVWNSARMDSMDNQRVSPLEQRDLGIPLDPKWQATYHESDPRYGTLGITKNICFLVDPGGNVDSNNVCCSPARCSAAPFFTSWPPLGYPSGTPTETIEGTKILPDGWFSPGTHIEFFARRSDAASGGLTGVVLDPDTTRVTAGQRFQTVGVLPDLWKDREFGGAGLACMLVVDATSSSLEQEGTAVVGLLDTLGYGKNNGAGLGWWENDWSAGNPNPDDPDNRVSQNLGQRGLAFDWYDARGTSEGGRPGCRLAVAPPELADRQCKAGPTPEMLKTYYNSILWLSGELSGLHDGQSFGQQSDDVGLIRGFLETSASGSERAVWIAGDRAAANLADALGDGPTLLAVNFAAVVEADDYRVASGNITTPIVYDPLIAEFHASRQYGYHNSCLLLPDVLAVNGAVPSGQLAAKYEDISHRGLPINPGAYGAAVYRPADLISRFYTTLITGHQIGHLRGSGPAISTTDFGRIAFVDDVLAAFGLCSALGPVIAVGDLPGPSGAQLSFVRGAFPNPSVTGKATVEFSLAQRARVTIRFYNVAGRLVHEAWVNGVVGPNRYRWDGTTSSGARAPSGVYFYRVSAPGIEFQNNNRRMVLLGSAGN